MKYIVGYKIFESDINDIDIKIQDAAWLYFLFYVYDGKLNIKTWSKDKRMGNGSTCGTSLLKFNFISIENGFYKSTNNDKCVELIERWFGEKTLIKCLIKSSSLIKYNNNDVYSGYKISSIPYDLYLSKNPKIYIDFEKIDNKIVNHFNSQKSNNRILDNLSKSRSIKEFNLVQFYKSFPNLPDTLKLYRGIKNGYDDIHNENGYSCWTHSKEEAIRFAKHIFTGKKQFSPIYSEDPHIIETEVKYEDIKIFIGGYESEVILKNPVNIYYITKLTNPIS